MSDDMTPRQAAEYQLATDPLKLTRDHVRTLELELGDQAAHDLINRHVQHKLRSVRIAPPYRVIK